MKNKILITGGAGFIGSNYVELIIENTEKALQVACNKSGAEIFDYTVAPIFMEGKDNGSHEWMIEFKKPPLDIIEFSVFLDKALQDVNSDYEAKRSNDITLKTPIIHCAREKLFYDWLKMKDKIGGQHKIPRLSNSRDFLEELLLLNE